MSSKYWSLSLYYRPIFVCQTGGYLCWYLKIFLICYTGFFIVRFVKSTIWLITCLIMEDITLSDGWMSLLIVEDFCIDWFFFSWVCQVFNVTNDLFGNWRYMSGRHLPAAAGHPVILLLLNNRLPILLKNSLVHVSSLRDIQTKISTRLTDKSWLMI